MRIGRPWTLLLLYAPVTTYECIRVATCQMGPQI
jgi:hypothetical protein